MSVVKVSVCFEGSVVKVSVAWLGFEGECGLPGESGLAGLRR